MKISKHKSMKQQTEPQSTYERLMQDPEFKKQFEIEYQEFALSEVILQLMKVGNLSVRGLAKAAEVSPSVIQDIRSGNRTNITLFNLSKILKVMGSRLAIQIGEEYMPLEG